MDVRIRGTSSNSTGRVEILYSGSWGTICHYGWDDTDATVVCRQLGFKFGRALRNGDGSEGKGEIWLNRVNCKGTETDIADCEATEWGTSFCFHFQDAGVVCTDYDTKTSK